MSLYCPQELIRLSLYQLGGYWWSSWDRGVVGVIITGSSERWWPPQRVERGWKDKLWGVKCCGLGAWGEQRCKAPQAGVNWVSLHQTGITHIGLEWRANRALLRLDVPSSKPLEKFLLFQHWAVDAEAAGIRIALEETQRCSSVGMSSIAPSHSRDLGGGKWNLMPLLK